MRAGDTLGRYEILDRLGEGGMGEVWLARDTRLGRKVALKTLPVAVAADPVRLRRFEGEAQAAAALNHPGIVTLYSVERAGATHFLTMEYVEGSTLEEIIPDAGMELPRFFDVAVPLAEALAAAHRGGIVHRDLKPANVMVTPDGRVKVLDFGLARFDDPKSPEATKTRSGVVAGTVPYMAPEQLRGTRVDARTDLFALGVVWHEMLTGALPFRGTSSAEIISAILRDPVTPIARTDVPPAVVDLIARCLEKDAALRPASAEDAAREVARARSDFVAGRVAAPKLPAKTTGTAGTTVVIDDFANLAGNTETDWLAAGIAETLLVDLKKVAGLRVLRNDGSSAARTAPVAVRGAFQAIGPAVRITARVADVPSGHESGAIKVDGRMEQIFELQDRLASGIAELLGAPGSLSPSGRAGSKLEAFECFARARVEVERMDPEAYVRARPMLERAIEIDPDYALARAVLGQLHALSFIGSTDRADLERAIAQLQRAAELDGGLGAAYQWLCYALTRAGRLGEAVAAGRHAIAVEPQAAMGHYFLAVALSVRAHRERVLDPWPEIFGAYAESARLASRYQPAHQLLGAALMARGRYDDARTPLERAAEIEASDDFELNRFLGGHAMLGRLALRRGRLDEALALAERSREICSSRVHFYAPLMLALGHGVAADALFRRARYADAVTELRRAIDAIEAHPRALSAGGILVRTRFALARCFRRLGMVREALTLFEEASDLLRSRAGFDFSWTAEVTDADLHYEAALYHAAADQPDEAGAALGVAIEHGWGDRPALDAEPLFAALASRPDWPPAAASEA